LFTQDLLAQQLQSQPTVLALLQQLQQAMQAQQLLV
jgi:hypothetical protein